MNELQCKVAKLSEGYKITDGIIRSCGKFEGESVASLYYYDCYLNGCGCVMEVTEEERDLFELSISDKWVYVRESNDGFISLEYYSSQVEAEEAEYEDMEGEY